MYSTHNEGYLSYLNKLVNQYNKAYHHSVNKKNLLMLIILIWLKKLRRILKLLNLNLMTESELQNIRIFLINITMKIGQEKYLLTTLC